MSKFSTMKIFTYIFLSFRTTTRNPLCGKAHNKLPPPKLTRHLNFCWHNQKNWLLS